MLLAYLLSALLGGGSAPSAPALDGVQPGQWEFVRPADKGQPVRMCVSDPLYLAQVVHRGRGCSIQAPARRDGELHVRYVCGDHGFGSATMRQVTPRSLRISTRGMLDGKPFNRLYHVRRVGTC